MKALAILGAVLALSPAAVQVSNESQSRHEQVPTIQAQELTAYVLGPDDLISIQSLDVEEISNKPIRIDTSGYINLPLVGRLEAANLTLPQLEAAVNDRLKQFVKNPRVAVSIVEFRSQPVSILGSVANPGVHQIEGRKTFVEVLSKAGGLRPDAGLTARITRRLEYGRVPLPGAMDDPTGQFSLAELNLKALMDAQAPEENIQIRPHDVISVPKADIIYVLGAVKKTGGFVVNQKRDVMLLEILAMAEGIIPTANGKKAEILRLTPGQSARTRIPVDIKGVLSGKGTNVAMLPEDILFVPTSYAKALGAKTIESTISAATSLLLWGAMY